jgi:hypothetical protein
MARRLTAGWRLGFLLGCALLFGAGQAGQAQVTSCQLTLTATPNPMFHSSGTLRGFNLAVQFRVTATRPNVCSSTKIVITDAFSPFAWKPPIPGGTRGPWLVFPSNSTSGEVDAQLCFPGTGTFTQPVTITFQAQQYLGSTPYVPVSDRVSLTVQPPAAGAQNTGCSTPMQPGGSTEPPPGGNATAAAAAFNETRSVFNHARCTTCHGGTTLPPSPHPSTIAGRAIGAGDCATCHHTPSTTNTVPASGVGGPVPLPMSNKAWQMAPMSMRLTSTMSARDICQQVKANSSGATDQAKAQAVASHVASDDLVRWAFGPLCSITGSTSGNCPATRPAAPGTHSGFVQQLDTWASNGGACP